MNMNSQLLPDTLRKIMALYLSEIEAHSLHHFIPFRRKEFLYHEIESFSSGLNNFYGWLAIITAEKVLPIFTNGMPTEKAPERLIRLAKRVCQHSLAKGSPRIVVYSDYVYHFSGNDWGDFDGEMSSNVLFAGDACVQALGEARGFRYLIDFYKYYPDSPETDSEISNGFLDTAGIASCAWAYEKNAQKSSSQKRLEFWRWWFTVAVPQAWKMSQPPSMS